MKDITGKVAFVTGGASGIGLAMVRTFLDHGIKVCVADYDVRHIEEARSLLGRDRDDIHFIRLDVTDRAAMAAAAQEVVKRFGAIHILCNNAGVGGPPAMEDADFADWDRIINVNLGGVINGIVAFLPLMKTQGQGGHIVNTSSMTGIIALPGDSGIYSTSKFAVRGLSESLRLSLVKYGIGVSLLCPGLVKTNMMADDIDDNSLFVLGDAALDPEEVGALVLNGILNDRFYLFPNGEFRDGVRELQEDLLAAFPEGPFLQSRLDLEDKRRKMMGAFAKGLC